MFCIQIPGLNTLILALDVLRIIKRPHDVNNNSSEIKNKKSKILLLYLSLIISKYSINIKILRITVVYKFTRLLILFYFLLLLFIFFYSVLYSIERAKNFYITRKKIFLLFCYNFILLTYIFFCIICFLLALHLSHKQHVHILRTKQ